MVSFLLSIFLATFSLAQSPAVIAQAEVVSTVEMSQIQRFLEPFEYAKEELRDPFEAVGHAAPLSPGQVYGPFLPLQTWLLTEFKLKGLMWKTKEPVAVFLAPDGNEHRLKVKDYIGENFGYIASIREKEVVIIQTIEEDNKRYSTTRVVFLD